MRKPYETTIRGTYIYDGFGKRWTNIENSIYGTIHEPEYKKLIETVQSAYQEYLKTVYEKNNGNF